MLRTEDSAADQAEDTPFVPADPHAIRQQLEELTREYVNVPRQLRQALQRVDRVLADINSATPGYRVTASRNSQGDPGVVEIDGAAFHYERPKAPDPALLRPLVPTYSELPAERPATPGFWWGRAHRRAITHAAPRHPQPGRMNSLEAFRTDPR